MSMPGFATFTTARGTLEYSLNGADEPTTRLLMHHGLIGSADLAREWAEVAASSGVQVLTIARPGYGRSTPTAMDTISDWVDIVLPLLDELDWQVFDVSGISAGAPYTYALAAGLGDRVRRVGICSGLPYVRDPAVMATYPAADQEAFARYTASTDDEVSAEIGRELLAFAEKLPAGHRWLATIEASLAHGGAGIAREVRLQQRDWGFDLAAITQPVRLWHAREDTEVPFAGAELTAARIPTATLWIQIDPQHFPSEQTGRELFRYLTEPSSD